MNADIIEFRRREELCELCKRRPATDLAEFWDDDDDPEKPGYLMSVCDPCEIATRCDYVRLDNNHAWRVVPYLTEAERSRVLEDGGSVLEDGADPA